MIGQATVSSNTDTKPTLEQDREMLGHEFQKLMFKVLKHRALKADVEMAIRNQQKEPIVVVFTYVNDDERLLKRRLHDGTFNHLAEKIAAICIDHPDYDKAMLRLIEVQKRYPNIQLEFYVGSRQRLASFENNITAFDARLMASMAERVDKTLKRT